MIGRQTGDQSRLFYLFNLRVWPASDCANGFRRYARDGSHGLRSVATVRSCARSPSRSTGGRCHFRLRLSLHAKSQPLYWRSARSPASLLRPYGQSVGGGHRRDGDRRPDTVKWLRNVRYEDLGKRTRSAQCG